MNQHMLLIYTDENMSAEELADAIVDRIPDTVSVYELHQSTDAKGGISVTHDEQPIA
jgi:hypothetical protein